MGTRRQSRRKQRQQQTRQTNWYVIGGIALVALIALGALLALSLDDDSGTTVAGTLAGYCEENPANCVSKGDENAPVTMVAIEDFACSHCRDYHVTTYGQLMAQYVDTGQVRYVALPYALRPETLGAAAASMCAADQDRYFEYSLALFQEFGVSDYLSINSLSRTAEAVGLDVTAFNECVSSGKHEDLIVDNQRAAASFGVSGTPNFFVNGAQLAGNYPYSQFQQQIELALTSSN